MFEWLPPGNQATPEAPALIKLTRNKEGDLPKLLRDLPIDKFEQIIDYFAGIEE